MPLSPDPQWSLATALGLLEGQLGRQHWWPAKSRFEMATGAVLVQHTGWRNAASAIANLERHGSVAPDAIALLPDEELAGLIRPSGTFRLKARRLRSLACWWQRHADRFPHGEPNNVREALLGVHGIGPETADCISLYAFGQPVFVADLSARRLLSRLGFVPAKANYSQTKAYAEARLPTNADYLGEAHALIVEHGKQACRARPDCMNCVLNAGCQWHRRNAGVLA
jgi:endonuclease-3 related protein